MQTLESRGPVACPLSGRAIQRRAKNPRGKWFCAGNTCSSLTQEIVWSLNIERVEESCRGMRSAGMWQPARPTSEILTYPCPDKSANGTPKWINLHIWLYWKGLLSFKAAISRGSGKYGDVYHTRKPVNCEPRWLWPRLQSPQEWLLRFTCVVKSALGEQSSQRHEILSNSSWEARPRPAVFAERSSELTRRQSQNVSQMFELELLQHNHIN